MSVCVSERERQTDRQTGVGWGVGGSERHGLEYVWHWKIGMGLR